MHKCAYCKDRIHLIDPDTIPEDRYSREWPEGSGKWQCGICRDDEMFQLKVKRGLATQYEIQRKMNEVARKADIKGMADSIKKNEPSDFSSLFKSPGIKKRRG